MPFLWNFWIEEGGSEDLDFVTFLAWIFIFAYFYVTSQTL